MTQFTPLIHIQEFWSSVGFWVLVVGLFGDILVLLPIKWLKNFEKPLTVVFTLVIVAGCWLEHTADTNVSGLVLKEEILFADRNLSPTQITEIANELRPFAGRGLIVGSYEGDGEGARIGTQISGLMHKAGIHVINKIGLISPSMNSDGIEFGIRIIGGNIDAPFTKALENSLGGLGRLSVNPKVLDATYSVDGAVVGIMICMKPSDE